MDNFVPFFSQVNEETGCQEPKSQHPLKVALEQELGIPTPVWRYPSSTGTRTSPGNSLKTQLPIKLMLPEQELGFSYCLAPQITYWHFRLQRNLQSEIKIQDNPGGGDLVLSRDASTSSSTVLPPHRHSYLQAGLGASTAPGVPGWLHADPWRQVPGPQFPKDISILCSLWQRFSYLSVHRPHGEGC